MKNHKSGHIIHSNKISFAADIPAPIKKFTGTQKKNLNQELEMEKSTLLSIFENAPTFLSIVRGRNYVYEMANKAFFDLVGRTDIIGKTVLECFPEVEEQGYIDLLDKVYTTGKTFFSKERKLMLYKKSQRKFVDIYVNFVYLAIRDKSGRINGIAAHGFDVTEQVTARKEAEEMRDKFETMANNIPNLAWVANPAGGIYWYNDRWYEYTGTTPEQMEGWGWQSVHDPDTLSAVLEQWLRSIKTGQSFEMIFPLKGADDVFRPFLTRVIPIRNNEGKIIRWLGTNTDITKQKEIERMKDDFIATASHELNTPVTIINLCTHVLEQSLKNNGDTVATEWLTKINTQVEKLIVLIKDMLDVSRLQTGHMQFNNISFDMNDLVIEIVGQLQEMSPNHHIEIDLPKTADMLGDRASLGRVITNFLTNAIKYSPDAHKVIVSTSIGKTDITLSVKDFGFGISKDKLNRVFEQFYRVTDNQQYTYPGLGLGLYISSEIIKSLKGKIWVESKINKGSTFYFRIPRVVKEAVLN